MIYLNNAATGFPKPPSVIEAVSSYLASAPSHGARAGLGEGDEDVVATNRTKLAEFFGAANADTIVFTSGATESLNLAIFGSNIRGGHVVTTAIEHNSVLRPLKTLERRGEITLSIAACGTNGGVSPSQVERMVRRDTRAIVVNHCSNVTGRITDIRSVSELASRNGALLIVDASQSAGSVPIDVKEARPDMVAFTGHKSLHGLPGVGGLYLREGLEIEPLHVGGTGIRSDLLHQPPDRPFRYEAGTQNLPGIVSLGAGVDFLREVGIETIAAKKREQFEKVVAELSRFPDIHIYGGTDLEHRSPLLSFNIRGIDPEDVSYMLEQSFEIVTRPGLHCAPLIHEAIGSYPQGSVRMSTSWFTTDRELEAFTHAIALICQRTRRAAA